MMRQNQPVQHYNRINFESEVLGVSTDELVNLLNYKMNLILQGAPGVGKTYTAKRLCWLLMGCKDNSRITQVQFHSSYTYEDFIKGLKPTESGGFKLESGPFYDICMRANRDKQRSYFMIIDEINRGNISAILGEAFSLIEKDHRNEPIMLKYNKEIFAVPKNLYIIGTMNTADRGLTMLDYALRRRFSFYTVLPAFDAPAFKNKMSLQCNRYLQKVLKQIRLLNIEIANDELLGPGFMIGHSYFCTDRGITNDVLNNIVEYEIIPLLKEYWYDDIDNRADKWAGILRGAMKDGQIQ